MAKPYPNKQGFLIIEMAPHEVAAVLDKFPYCDLCSVGEGNRFYIPVINQVYCDTCLQAWLSGAIRYKVDIPQEKTLYSGVQRELESLGIWNA